MKRLKYELNALANRSVDRQLRIAVTGLSRSGKTAFITSLVNQLVNISNGARLPLFSAARENRLLGAKRIPQRDLGIARFGYDDGIAKLYGEPPSWPTPTHGVSEISLALRYRSQDSLLRHFRDTATLYLEIIDYPGEWLLDLPMLGQDYLTWSQQMLGLLVPPRAEWAEPWRQLCAGLDPLAAADENRLAAIAESWTAYLLQCKSAGQHFIQPGRFVLPGEMAGAPALQFFPWPDSERWSPAQLNQAPAGSNFALLHQRYRYYCQHVVKRFYQDYFVKFDRQIVLVDCLQPLNSGPVAFNDMRLALSQLMQSFHYGQRTLFRRLFSPTIDKLLFAATKADHITADQHGNLVALLQQLIQDARQTAAFEGITIDCLGLAAIQATQNGVVNHQGNPVAALRGQRLSDGKAITVFPGDVPARLPERDFWAQQGFHFEDFRPAQMAADIPLPHIRMDAALEFLIGDKLR